MDRHERRALVICRPNPDPGRDFISSWCGQIADSGGTAAIDLRIRYVPDRLILDAESLGAYLDGIGAASWPSLEALSKTLVEDMQNELVPRWIQVVTRRPGGEDGARSDYSTCMEDRQPGWQNTAILDRLDQWD